MRTRTRPESASRCINQKSPRTKKVPNGRPLHLKVPVGAPIHQNVPGGGPEHQKVPHLESPDSIAFRVVAQILPVRHVALLAVGVQSLIFIIFLIWRRVLDLEFRVPRFKGEGSGFRVQGLGFRV